jgi:hypothetical protein
MFSALLVPVCGGGAFLTGYLTRYFQSRRRKELNATIQTATASGQDRHQQMRLLVPRRIDVLKVDETSQVFFRLEVDDFVTYTVPIGPRLVAALIEGLQRAQRAFPASPVRH